MSRLRSTFARHRFTPEAPEDVSARVTRRLSELTTHTIPEFFGLAESSMMADDGWRFCRLGQQLERGIINGQRSPRLFQGVHRSRRQAHPTRPPHRD